MVERLVVTADGPIIHINVLPPELLEKQGTENGDKAENGENEGRSLKEMLREYEASIIREKYTELKSSYKVAKALKISQSQANTKIREYVFREKK